MKFDPISEDLYTDGGEFVKQMNCPYKVKWENLEVTDSNARMCSNCDHEIIDTELLSDDELLDLVKNNPSTCLKIDLNQNNTKLHINGTLEQR